MTNKNPDFVKIGYKRLYKCLGLNIANTGDVRISETNNNGIVEITVSKKPKYGIPSFSVASPFIVPGKIGFPQAISVNMERQEFGDVNYLEIVYFKIIYIDESSKELFSKIDPGIYETTWSEVEKQKSSINAMLDLISGSIGLRFHRQFVFILFNTCQMIHYTDKSFQLRYLSPTMELL